MGSKRASPPSLRLPRTGAPVSVKKTTTQAAAAGAAVEAAAAEDRGPEAE